MQIGCHPRVSETCRTALVMHECNVQDMQLSAAESCPIFPPLQLWKNFNDAVEAMRLSHSSFFLLQQAGV
jgi:hypothetical protein